MEIRLWSVVLTICCFVAVQRQILAEDAPKPESSLPTVDDLDLPFTSKTTLDMKPLFAEVQTIVAKYYPKAKVTYDESLQRIQFEYLTRKFMFHGAQYNGYFTEEAYQETGPNPNGIYGMFSLRKGKYIPQSPSPHSENRLYFLQLNMDPYSKQLDRQLLVTMKYRSHASKEFIAEMERLAENFEKYMPSKTK